MSQTSEESQDGGVRGWLVVIAGFLMITIVAGIRRSMGLVFLEIMELTDAPRSSASFVLSTYFCCSMGGSLFVVFLVRRFGTRVVVFLGGGCLASTALFSATFVKQIELFILFLGVLLGLGHSCTYIPTMVLVSQHFKKRRTLAVAICGAGGAVGALVIPPFLAFASDRFAGPGMFMLLAGINLHCLISATLMRPPNTEEDLQIDPNETHRKEIPEIQIDLIEEEETHEESGAHQNVGLLDRHVTRSTISLHDPLRESSKDRPLSASVISMLDFASATSISAASPENDKPTPFYRMRSFYEVIFTTAFVSFGQVASYILTPLIAKDIDINRYYQSLFLLLAGCSDLGCRFFVGIVADRHPKYRPLFYVCSAIVSGIVWIMVANVTTFAGILSFSLLQGAIASCYITLGISVSADIVGLKNLDVTMSCRAAIQAVLNLVMPPFMAFVRETSGFWRYNCYAPSILCALAILIISRHVVRIFSESKQTKEIS